MELPPAWRQAAADARRALEQQFLGEKPSALYAALGTHTVDAATGGALFFAGVAAAQTAQRMLRINTSTPLLLPQLVGGAAVAASSAAALHFASLPREIWEHVALERNHASTVGGFWTRATLSEVSVSSVPSTLSTSTRQKLQARVEELRDAPYPVYMIMGLLCFKMLGGRLNALAPSNFSNLGAFHLKKASLPATAEYATPIERGIIQEFGRLYGCHTCGVKRGVKFHADHMPPKLVAQRKDASLFRRLLGRKVAFRFYPQCEPCSNQQGTVVKQWKTKLRTHFLSLRLYHSTGLWLVLLCTGGLYVGGSSFHEMSDVESARSQAAAAAAASDDLSQFVNHHATSEHALLVSLRERESKLRRSLKAAKDAAEAAALRVEIDAIARCKQSLKANMKREREMKKKASNS